MKNFAFYLICAGLALTGIVHSVNYAAAVHEHHQIQKEEDRVIELRKRINQVRTEHNLPTLKVSWKLQKMAHNHTLDICETHEGGRHSDYDENYAENLASGTRLSPAVAVKLWMESGGHRANMLGDHKSIGIGIASKPSRCQCVFYTVIFQ